MPIKKDIITPGLKYHKLTSIEETNDKKKTKGRYVKCQCDCGKIANVLWARFKKGLIKSCGCIVNTSEVRQIFNPDSLNGYKFNMITIISFSHKVRKKTKSDYYFNYVCDCGKTGIIEKERINKNMSCGCYWLFNPNRLSGTKFRTFKKNAKTRKIEFNLSKEYLQNLYDQQNQKCALSGQPIRFQKSKTGDDATASLDRIDSSKPYEEGNVQWVHKIVNVMKHVQLKEDLIKWCNFIVEHNKGRF